MDKIQGTNTAVASSISLLTHDVEKLRIQNTQLVRVSCAKKFEKMLNRVDGWACNRLVVCWNGLMVRVSSIEFARLSGTITHGQHRACGHGDQLAWNSF